MFSTISHTLFSRIVLLLLTVSVLSIGCQPDDTQEDGTITLRHDGDNDFSPELPGASIYESAVRFPATQVEAYVGDELTEIDFYIFNVPSSCELFVYTSSNGNVPENEVYRSGNLVNTLNSEAFNTHVLTTPLVLDNEDLWIGVRFTHNSGQRTIGCDTGPADTNGDWLFDSTDGFWQPLVQRTNGGININWNIRGIVELKE